MRILGLDLSLRSTGYVLLDDDQVVWHGVVGFPELRDAVRLAHFDDWIRNVALPSQAGRPDRVLALWRLTAVAIEGYSYGSPQAHTHAFALGELGGLVKLATLQAGVELHAIAANTWKKTLCGKGGLAKDLCRLELYKRYGVEFAKQDTLDAWAVAMTLRRQLLGLDKPEPKSRRGRKAPVIPPQEAAFDEESATTPRRLAVAEEV